MYNSDTGAKPFLGIDICDTSQYKATHWFLTFNLSNDDVLISFSVPFLVHKVDLLLY